MKIKAKLTGEQIKVQENYEKEKVKNLKPDEYK